MQQKDSNEHLEALLEAPGGATETEKEPVDTDVEKYIRDLRMEPGDDFVQALIVYYTYCLWRPVDRVNKVVFFRRFSKIFNSLIKSSEVGYMLDNHDEIFDTSVVNKFAAKKFMKHSRKQKKDAKKAKKTRKSKKQDKTRLADS